MYQIRLPIIITVCFARSSFPKKGSQVAFIVKMRLRYSIWELRLYLKSHSRSFPIALPLHISFHPFLLCAFLNTPLIRHFHLQVLSLFALCPSPANDDDDEGGGGGDSGKVGATVQERED